MLKKLCFILLILFLVLSAAFIPGCSLTPDRYVYLKYSFFVEPLGDENIKDFVLYLPFPNYREEIINEAFRETKERYFKYGAETMDKAIWEKVSTEHGPMLRVKAHTLHKGVGSGCEVSITEKLRIKEYYLWQDTGNHRHTYLYKPRFEIKKKDKKRYAQTMIYSKGKGGNGFKLGIRYDISDRTPAPFPFIFSHGGGGDLIAFFGTEQPPDPIIGSAGVTFKIKEFGWKTIPVAECE